MPRNGEHATQQRRATPGRRATDLDASEALRLSEERFALAMQGANDGLWDRDFRTGAVYYSPRWKSMLGYSEDEIEHTLAAFEEMVHPDDRERRLAAVNGYINGTVKRHEVELRIQHKHGHYVTVLARATAARDASGRVVRMVGTHTDISDQKRASQRLAAQYAATRVLAEATTIKETVPRFLDAICQSAGWDLGCTLVGDSSGQHLRSLSIWKSKRLETGIWETRLRDRRYAQGEGLAGWVWKTGQPAWVARADHDADFPADAHAAGMNSLCVAPLVVGHQTVAVLEFYSRDIRPRDDDWLTMLASINVQVEQSLRRRQMERELEQAKSKYLDIVEQSQHGIYQTTPEGRIVSANRAFARTFGYDSPDQILTADHPIAKGLWVDPDGRDVFVQQVEGHGSVKGFETRLRHRSGGAIWVSIDARTVRDERGAVLYYEGSLEDITDRKEAEQMKSDFVSFATHQLRTPLAGIKWMLELAHTPELPEESASYIADARASADRLIRLVNDLLDVSRLEGGRLATNPEPTDLALLSNEVVHELMPLAHEKGQSLVLTPAPGIPPVIVDPKLGREVVLNLISNALRYTPNGGAITVEMRLTEGAVEWAVRDTGIGIPVASQQRLFEKFYRADNAAIVHTEGTGLGLYLVRLVLERSGGRVWCESTEGAGSTFRFTLPLAG